MNLCTVAGPTGWEARGTAPGEGKDTADGSAQAVETSLEQLCVFISELACLVGGFNAVHGLASRGGTDDI